MAQTHSTLAADFADWVGGRMVETLARDDVSTTMLVEDNGRQLVARAFEGLVGSFERLLPELVQQQRRLHLPGLARPTGLLPFATGSLLTYRPVRAVPLLQTGFTAIAALSYAAKVTALVSELHALGLMGIELQPERFLVNRRQGPVWVGLIGAREFWSIDNGFDELRTVEFDARADLPALGRVFDAIAERIVGRPDKRAQILRHLAVALAAEVPSDRPTLDAVFGELGQSVAASARVFLPVARRVGREPLLREVEAMIARRMVANGGNAALIAIVGRAGMGKTRVVAEIAQRLQRIGHRVLAARARDWDRRLLGPLEDIALQLESTASHEASAGLEPLSPDAARRRRIERSLRSLLDRIVATPTVIILEDIDRAAASALDGLSYLARELVLEGGAIPLCIVVTLRMGEGDQPDGTASRVVAELREDGFAERVRLPQLDAESVHAMLASLYVDRREDRDHIAASARGNPQLVDQLARLCQQRVTTLAPLADAAAIVSRRVHELTECEQRVVDALAVLNRPSDLRQVAELVVVGDRAHLFCTVIGLVQDGFLRLARAGKVELADSGVAATIAGDIGIRRSRELHRRAGRVLSDGTEVDLEAAATHFELAGDRDRFTDLGAVAAHLLERAGYSLPALALFRRLLLSLGSRSADPRRVVFLEQIAALCNLVGESTQAVAAYRELLELPHPPDRSWQYHKSIGRALRDAEQPALAAAAFDDGLELLGAGDDLRIADLLSEKAYVLSLLGDADGARRMADQAGSMAAKLEESQKAAEIRNRVGTTLVKLGDVRRGITHIEAGLRMSECLGALELAARALNNLGLELGYPGGEWSRGLAYCQRSLEIWERLGDLQRIAQTSANIGALYLRGCDVENAEIYLERGLRIARRFGRSGIVMQCMLNLAELHQLRGRLGDALEARQRVLRLAEQLKQPRAYGEQLFAMCRDYAQLGEEESVERMSMRLHELARKHDDPLQRGLAIWSTAALARLRNQPEVARRELREAEQILYETGAHEYRISCLLERADLELLFDKSAATDLALAVIESAQRLELRVDHALGLLTLAEALLSSSRPRAERVALEAEEIVSRLLLPELRWRCDYIAGELAHDRGEPLEAERRFRSAREVLELLVGSIKDAAHRYRYMTERRRVLVLRRARTDRR